VVGDHIRIRSGALGGILDVWVLEMSLTYVTVRADDGVLKIPNTAMLAAGVGKLPLGPVAPHPTQGPPARASSAQAASAEPGLVSNDGGQAPGAQSLVDQAGGDEGARDEGARDEGARDEGARDEGAGAQSIQGGAKPRRARLSRPRPGRSAATRVKANVEDPGSAPPAAPGRPEPPA